MVLVIALPELAQRVAELIDGPRAYVIKVTDGRELRKKVHEHQPEIVLLDYRMGGSAWRAVDEIAAIADRTRSQPYVIAVVPWKDREVARANAKAGAYNVVVFKEKALKTFSADLSVALSVARAARAARAVAPRQSKKEENYH